MIQRRNFFSKLGMALGALALAPAFSSVGCRNKTSVNKPSKKLPILISTWNAGLLANPEGLKALQNGGTALDAVEQGVRIVEADASNNSVGLGGLPDRDGHVTLDACIMDWQGRAGSVCFLENILHPVSVARRIMEKTPHVMLVGAGAYQFAQSEGFEKTDLLTPKSIEAFKKWQTTQAYKPVINIENHDTIGMVALDQENRLAGSCTTSGLAYKMHGRVGDSPIIGAGLYIDNEVGGAVATGLGESVLRCVSSFLVVELMRQGKSPTEACKEAVVRIVEKHANYKEFQVGIIALNKAGETGGYSIQPGFDYARTENGITELISCESYL